MSNPLVSVVAISYNQVDTIEPAVRAILAQTYSPLQIVFSDDCSTDGTLDLIETLVAEYDGPHEVIVTKTHRNLGIVGNLNHGIERTTGELIVQQNGDDISLPHRVASLAAEWQKDPDRNLLLYSKCDAVDYDGTIIHKDYIARKSALELPIPEFVYKELYAGGAATAYSRRIFEHFGPVPSMAAVEDHVLPFRARYLGDICFIDETLLHLRPNGLSWSEGALDRSAKRKQEKRRALNFRAYLVDLDKMSFEGKSAVSRYCRLQIAKDRLNNSGLGRALWSVVPKRQLKSILVKLNGRL